MLWLLFILLVLFWLGGFALNVVGDVIHILLVVAVVVLLMNLLGFGGRRELD